MTEVEILFSEILKCGRLDLYLERSRVLPLEQVSRIASALERRIKGEPLQYILGKTEFMGLEFKVSPDVLVPRPETEILVEKALEVCSRLTVDSSQLNILDIGTGSGCIAVTLSKLLPKTKVTAIDISDKALEIAKQNAELNNVSVNFLKSDLFSSCQLPTTSYQLIVANPPYIPSQDIGKLQQEVQHEPKLALDGGQDGLDFYRRIIAQAPAYLKEGGLLLLEIGFGQTQAIGNILESSGKFKIMEVAKDYHNIDRVMTTKKR